jgi:hypothetical protein
MVYGLYLADIAPQRTKSEFFKYVASELLLMLVELSTFLYAVDDSMDYLTEDSRILVGWTIIGFTGTIILIQLVVNAKY